MNELYIQKLIDAGFFDFEKAESMLTEELFQSLKDLKLHDIVMVLKEIRNERKKMSLLDKRKDSYDTFESRILGVLDASSFWIQKQNVLKMIQYKK